jgi:hypothetical protein
MFKLSKLQKFAIVATLACAGFFVYWMMSSGGNSKTAVTKSLVNARKLCTACRVYASEHDGNFPGSLDALVPNYLKDRSELASPLMPSEPVGYTYTAGMKYTGPVNAVVIEDKFGPAQHVRIVAYVDGSARVLPSP